MLLMDSPVEHHNHFNDRNGFLDDQIHEVLYNIEKSIFIFCAQQ